MKRHAFSFGTAANVRYLRSGAAVDLRDAVLPLGRRPVGLRFRLDIPQGADVTGAHIQFSSAADDQDISQLQIDVQDIDDAPDFREQDVLSRQSVSDPIEWSPTRWNSAGDRGSAQRTPDLASLLSAATSRPSWTAGNHIAVLITGDGSHAARSFDADPAQAPVLVVTFDGATVEIPIARLEDDAEQIETAENTARYREELLRLFNYVTLENALKWHRWTQDPQSGLNAVQWAADHDLSVRGHALVWSSSIPSDVQARFDDPEFVRASLEEKLVERSTELRGKVAAWDVLNEPLHRQELEQVIGFGDRVKWFQLAQEADPHVPLFINEYGILEGGVRYEEYKQLIGALIDEGAPVQGVGVQGHFWSSQPSQAELWHRLESLAELDLPIEITEFDMNSAWPQAQQADHMEKLLVTAFSHPSVTAFIMWGFWDGRHWRNNAPLFNENWTLKPSGEAWIDLVHNQWWTDETLLSDAEGEVALRGFLGDYDVEVDVDGRRHTASHTLAAGGSVAEIRLPFATGSEVIPEVAEGLLSEIGHYPNPASGQTTVRFDLSRDAQVDIALFDVLGREVLRIPANSRGAGSGQGVVLDLSGLTAGMYVYRVTATAADQEMTASGHVVVMR